MLQPLLLPIWERLKQNHYSIILRWKPNRNEPFYNAFERLKWLKESNQITYTFSKIIPKAFILNWLPFILKQHLVSPHIAPEEMRLKEVKWFFGITRWLFGEEWIWFLCLWFLKTILSPTKLYKSVTKKKDLKNRCLHCKKNFQMAWLRVNDTQNSSYLDICVGSMIIWLSLINWLS